jgi:hypothetical protein
LTGEFGESRDKKGHPIERLKVHVDVRSNSN